MRPSDLIGHELQPCLYRCTENFTHGGGFRSELELLLVASRCISSPVGATYHVPAVTGVWRLLASFAAAFATAAALATCFVVVLGAFDLSLIPWRVGSCGVSGIDICGAPAGGGMGGNVGVSGGCGRGAGS